MKTIAELELELFNVTQTLETLHKSFKEFLENLPAAAVKQINFTTAPLVDGLKANENLSNDICAALDKIRANHNALENRVTALELQADA